MYIHTHVCIYIYTMYMMHIYIQYYVYDAYIYICIYIHYGLNITTVPMHSRISCYWSPCLMVQPPLRPCLLRQIGRGVFQVARALRHQAQRDQQLEEFLRPVTVICYIEVYVPQEYDMFFFCVYINIYIYIHLNMIYIYDYPEVDRIW